MNNQPVNRPLGTPGNPTAILLAHCRDRRGINAEVTRFIARHGGNIVDYDQHVDEEEGVFFLRIEWTLDGFDLARSEIASSFAPVAKSFDMVWKLHFSDTVPRMCILVSRQPHCLYDLLARAASGEWQVEIPLIMGNHPDLSDVAQQFRIPYETVPIFPETKAEQEKKELELFRKHKVDFVVLARYMQILSPYLVDALPDRIINIHHSFLPAFAGARPYHAAAERGVKIIGATSHYVTADLDSGPIIEQDIIRVSHKDSVPELVRKGRDLEKLVLARAVWLHLQNKILVYRNKTVIFG